MWQLEWTKQAQKKLNKLGVPVKKRILIYLDETIEQCSHPTQRGEPMTENKAGLWRYRVGDYRIICKIEDHRLMIIVLNVGHRKDVYKD